MNVRFDLGENGTKGIVITNVIVLIGAVASLIWNAAVVTEKVERNMQTLADVRRIQSTVLSQQVDQRIRITRLETILDVEGFNLSPQENGTTNSSSTGTSWSLGPQPLEGQEVERPQPPGRRPERSERFALPERRDNRPRRR